jgi:hypothetical protein
MLFSTERTGRVEFYLGVQYLVAGRVNNAPIFCDVEIGTFKCHISLRADKYELHDCTPINLFGDCFILPPGPTPRKHGADPYPSNA